MTLVYKLLWWKYDDDGALVDSGNDSGWNDDKEWIKTHRHCFERKHPGYHTNISVIEKTPTTWMDNKLSTLFFTVSWDSDIFN